MQLYSQNATELLRKNIDNSFTNSEFLVQNPTFYWPESYFPKLSDFFNKIVKETVESYMMDNNENKYYGDSDDRTLTVHYYVFDKNGHISDKYGITYSDDGHIYSKYHCTYKVEGNKYKITTTDLKDSEEKIEEYEILEKDKIKHYLESYVKGTLIKKTSFLINGDVVSTLTYDANTRKYVQYENSKVAQEETEYLQRNYSNDGFLTEQITRPLKDGSKGDYDFLTREVFSEPDEFFLKEFK